MEKAADFFNDLSYLEQKCSGCQTILDFGVNTEFSDEHGSHVCGNCGHKL